MTSARDFWSLVDVADDMRSCWRWMGTTRGDYGVATVDGEQVAAHRYAWTFAYGEIPTGALILHSCDEPLCVNPRHLRLGTHEDNNADKSVLTRVRAALVVPPVAAPIEPVIAGAGRAIHARIREYRVARGLTQTALASAVGTTKSCVCHWEKGVSAPTAKRLTAVAEALGVSVSALFAEAA